MCQPFCKSPLFCESKVSIVLKQSSMYRGDRTKWYGQNGMGKMVCGQNGIGRNLSVLFCPLPFCPRTMYRYTRLLWDIQNRPSTHNHAHTYRSRDAHAH